MLSCFNWKSASGALFQWGYHSYSIFVETYSLFSPDYSTLGNNSLCFLWMNFRGVHSRCNGQVYFCDMTLVQIRENSARSKVLPARSQRENLLEVTLINLDALWACLKIDLSIKSTEFICVRVHMRPNSHARIQPLPILAWPQSRDFYVHGAVEAQCGFYNSNVPLPSWPASASYCRISTLITCALTRGECLRVDIT
jgi:hypothetical protein